MPEKRKRSLGAPPADWLTQRDLRRRGSSETQRLPRIGGPPPEFGGKGPDRKEPLTALLVCDECEAAARVAIAFARAGMSVRLALRLEDAEALLEGATAVFAVVPRGDSPVARALRLWGEGRAVFALVRDEATAALVRDGCDAALLPPWDVVATLGTLRR